MTLEEIKKVAVPACSEFKVKKLDIFGSLARGAGTPDSDVDLLVRVQFVVGAVAWNAESPSGELQVFGVGVGHGHEQSQRFKLHAPSPCQVIYKQDSSYQN